MNIKLVLLTIVGGWLLVMSEALKTRLTLEVLTILMLTYIHVNRFD